MDKVHSADRKRHLAIDYHLVVDRDSEGSSVRLGVVHHHLRQLQLINAPARQTHADQPGCLVHHECNLLWSRLRAIEDKGQSVSNQQ